LVTRPFYLVLYNINTNKDDIDNFTHATTVEIVWTIVPTVTLKVVGHQWYWSYEYSDYNHLTEKKYWN
jgi:heme/copper-type cytochrome/quinol oxidase subunit 2